MSGYKMTKKKGGKVFHAGQWADVWQDEKDLAQPAPQEGKVSVESMDAEMLDNLIKKKR